MGDIDKVFEAIKREDFLPVGQKGSAYLDMPISIGYGQTNSQPSTVRMMVEWLGAQAGDKVLDVGSGSGWTAALLAHIVGPEGEVYAVEKIPGLVTFGQENCERAGVSAEFFEASESLGLPEYSPFDRILVSASAETLPGELVDQLTINGKMVIPVGTDVLEVVKTGRDTRRTKSHPGFVFVPLTRESIHSA